MSAVTAHVRQHALLAFHAAGMAQACAHMHATSGALQVATAAVPSMNPQQLVQQQQKQRRWWWVKAQRVEESSLAVLIIVATGSVATTEFWS